MVISLNEAPIEKKIRVARHDSFSDKILAQVGQKRLTNEEIQVISEWLTSLKVEHYCWYREGKISFSNEVEVINITKADLKRVEKRKKEEEKEALLQESLQKFPIPIQKFIENYFNDVKLRSKNQISLLLNGEIEPAEVKLRWSFSRFDDFVQDYKIDITSINTLEEMWECVRNAYLNQN